MTATEDLRRLLGERGVEWTENDGWYVKETCWPYMGELTAAFAEYYDGTTHFACDTWCFTPEQAIEATLGRGECRDVNEEDNDFTCSECGASMFTMIDGCWTMIGRSGLFKDVIKHPSYCPSCGKKVADDCR